MIKKILLVSLFILPLGAAANGGGSAESLKGLIKEIENACQKTYIDKFSGQDSNHAQLYCISAFEFSCIKNLESAKSNCAEIKKLNLLEKCPVCAEFN